MKVYDEQVAVSIIRNGTSMTVPFCELRTGDQVQRFANIWPFTVTGDAHISGDADYEGWIVDGEDESYFPEDFGAKLKTVEVPDMEKTAALFKETAERANQVNKAVELIRRAAAVQLLSMPDENSVLLIVEQNGLEEWVVYNILEAAISLLNTGYMETLREHVEEKEQTPYSVAIDGPAGAGKTSTAKALAQKLGFRYVDTGAFYRALAAAKKLRPEQTVREMLKELQLNVSWDDNGTQHMYVDDLCVDDELRMPEISRAASDISALPEVREFLLNFQRDVAREHNVVMEGRDIGTVILPDATAKIYLTANPLARAARRYLDLGEQGDPQELLKSMMERDYNDSHRAVAPLKQAEDAKLVDNSSLSFDETLDRILELIQDKVPAARQYKEGGT